MDFTVIRTKSCGKPPHSCKDSTRNRKWCQELRDHNEKPLYLTRDPAPGSMLTRIEESRFIKIANKYLHLRFGAELPLVAMATVFNTALVSNMLAKIPCAADMIPLGGNADIHGGEGYGFD